MSREQIYSALFSLVQGTSSFAYTSRKLKAWSDVSPDQQPALFMAQSKETPTIVTRLPVKWVYLVDLYIYCYSNDPTVSPSIQLNGLLDNLANALAPAKGLETQPLRGLVGYARLSGDIQTDEGVLGSQAVAVVTVEILVNA